MKQTDSNSRYGVRTLMWQLATGAAVSCLAMTTAAAATNIALNPSRTGTPSPLESNSGWGGGSDKWDIIDGLRSYNSWANGLAFTGGHATSSGGPPYLEPAGVRQTTIDFGGSQSFNQVVVWHHGVEHTPMTANLDYWNGTQWQPISFTRNYGTMHEEGQNSGYSDSDIYDFAAVTGSKIRYSFDNSGQNINGSLNIHGWIYEMEVMAVPEPETYVLMLAGLGLIGVAARRRMSSARSCDRLLAQGGG